MRIFYLLITLLAAVLAQWGFSFWDIGGIPPPFIPAVVFFWFLKLNLPGRLWLALGLGLVFDSFRTFPFGTYLIVFFLEALLVEILQAFFSSMRSSLTQGVSLGIMLLFFFGSVPGSAWLISRMTGSTGTFGILLLPTVVGAILWTGIFALVFTVSLKLWRGAVQR